MACHDVIEFTKIHHECVGLPAEEMLNVDGGKAGSIEDAAGPDADGVGCPTGNGFGITDGVEVEDCNCQFLEESVDKGVMDVV